MGRHVPNKVKTAVRTKQGGTCLCGVKSHFEYVDLADPDDQFGAISEPEVVMLCRPCSRSKSIENLRGAKRSGIIYMDPNRIPGKLVRIKAGQRLEYPIWHRWIVGLPQPQNLTRRTRSIITGSKVDQDRIEEYDRMFRETIAYSIERRRTCQTANS